LRIELPPTQFLKTAHAEQMPPDVDAQVALTGEEEASRDWFRDS